MQFQIPQFIETEDKIVGPLTLKQFFYLGGAGGISALLYSLISTPIIWFVASAPIIAAGIALAFLKINGQPFTKIIVSALGFYWEPQKYVWHPENPAIQKSESSLQSMLGSRFSIESIVSGLALRGAREQIQTSNQAATEKSKRAVTQVKERLQLYDKITGDREVAHRVDYR